MRKKRKSKDDLIYRHGFLLVGEKTTCICRFCWSFGRENDQLEAQREFPGAQPAADASRAGQPKKKRRASMNPSYFSDFSRAILN
jgi:hypothetical protein